MSRLSNYDAESKQSQALTAKTDLLKLQVGKRRAQSVLAQPSDDLKKRLLIVTSHYLDLQYFLKFPLQLPKDQQQCPFIAVKSPILLLPNSLEDRKAKREARRSNKNRFPKIPAILRDGIKNVSPHGRSSFYRLSQKPF